MKGRRLHKVDTAWLLLIGLTLAGSALGEWRHGGVWVVLGVALATAFKGRLVMDAFLELDRTAPWLQRTVRAFGLLVPVLIVVTYLWGEELARFRWLP